MIILSVLISFALFHVLADRSRLRELYSSALAGSYVRLMMQYIGGEKLRLWEYKNLPFSLSEKVQVPFTLDFSVYPIAAYLFIQFMPKDPFQIVRHYILYVGGAVLYEMLLIAGGFIILHHWNHFLSILFFLTWAVLIHWHYIIFRRWWAR
jgi:hypothetical protein